MLTRLFKQFAEAISVREGSTIFFPRVQEDLDGFPHSEGLFAAAAAMEGLVAASQCSADIALT